MDTVKDLFCAELNEIKKEIKNIKKEEKESCRQNLLNLFKCVVCFESAPNSYMSCPYCGRYLGCYKCISLYVNVCHCKIRRQMIDKRNESDGSLSQTSTIPATGNLPDLAHPWPDETS